MADIFIPPSQPTQGVGPTEQPKENLPTEPPSTLKPLRDEGTEPSLSALNRIFLGKQTENFPSEPPTEDDVSQFLETPTKSSPGVLALIGRSPLLLFNLSQKNKP